MIKKYEREQNEAQYVISRGILPFKIITSVPKLLAKSLRRFLRKRNYNDIGVTTDEDSVWLWRYRDEG